MDFTITLGWWIVPVILTALAWWPLIRHEPDWRDYSPDVVGILIFFGAIIATLFIWLIYTAIGWSLS